MTHTVYYIAQLSFSLAKAPLNDPMMEEFVVNLPVINGLSDKAPGFVWRLQTEKGDATGIRGFDNPLKVLNMSVWESIQSLKNFVYRSEHVDFYRRSKQWFTPVDEPTTVLWWVPSGHIPSVDEGIERLNYLTVHGPSEYAFSFAKQFPSRSVSTDQETSFL